MNSDFFSPFEAVFKKDFATLTFHCSNSDLLCGFCCCFPFLDCCFYMCGGFFGWRAKEVECSLTLTCQEDAVAAEFGQSWDHRARTSADVHNSLLGCPSSALTGQAKLNICTANKSSVLWHRAPSRAPALYCHNFHRGNMVRKLSKCKVNQIQQFLDGAQWDGFPSQSC